MTQNPSRNQANNDELAGLFIEVFDKFLSGIDDCLPGIVEDYDAEQNRASVKILIQKVGTNNSLTSRAIIASIPVFQLGAGGFMINCKPVKGDFGWVKATDRDISLFLQNYEETKPNTFRKHSFSDAVFFPDVMRNYTVTEGEGLVIQKTDGSQRIALLDDSVKITATHVILDTDLTETTGDLIVDGDIENTGDVLSDGNVRGNTVESDTEVTANADTPASVGLSTHVHTGNQGSPTSSPTPGT